MSVQNREAGEADEKWQADQSSSEAYIQSEVKADARTAKIADRDEA